MRSVLNTLLWLAFVVCLRGQTIDPAELAKSGAVTGQAVVYGTYWKPSLEGMPPPCVVTAVATKVCAHNLNSTLVKVAVWNTAGDLVRPALVQRTSVNSVTVTFDSAFTGIVVIK